MRASASRHPASAAWNGPQTADRLARRCPDEHSSFLSGSHGGTQGADGGSARLSTERRFHLCRRFLRQGEQCSATTRQRSRPSGRRSGRTPRPSSPEPRAREDGSRTQYVLEMLPYPSGDLHMGHVKNYTIGDALCHQRRRHGLRVLHPMGYDAFGLPAENAAIREGRHPREVTTENIAAIRKQMKRMGWSIDWSRELSTAAPEYYRWTQWIFLLLFEQGLATSARPRSTGARSTRPCSPTSRSSTATASAAARWSRVARSRSGTSRSPSMHSASWTTWRCSRTGQSACCRCSATGSGAPRAPRCCSINATWARRSPSSRRARTRSSARRSSSSRPSTPSFPRSSRARRRRRR